MLPCGVPHWDSRRCTGCGLCVEACEIHGGALVLWPGGHLAIEQDTCEGCGICESVCPTGALECELAILWPATQAD
ncbi:MAG: ATP-binding protein [Anaerolineae bacterium]